uniref:Enoyl-CoA hydratase/isomerase family protein n=1 Tax=Phenylobacterium glaciei TaxID=2803784 RepID=A0A974P7E6_9CAUL|nr:enoyl-CoA hydratase/isomerase family protein [Phenylobacterium glaciei]
MTYEHLDLRVDGDVIWATMNRPERLNALNRKLVEELRDFFVGLYWRRDVRVVVLCGAGGAFCAGLDLKERSGSNTDGKRSVGPASPASGRSARSSSPCAAARSRSSPASTARPAAAASPWPWPPMFGSPPRAPE